MKISTEIRKIINEKWRREADFAIKGGQQLSAGEECDIIIEAYESVINSAAKDAEIAALRKANAGLAEALKYYADENEWNRGNPASAWRLYFNCINKDGHGYEIAREALATHDLTHEAEEK